MFFLGPTKVIQLVLIRINRRKLLRLLYLIVSVSILEGVDLFIKRLNGPLIIELVEGILKILEVWSFVPALLYLRFRHMLAKLLHIGSIVGDVPETLETSRKYKIEGIADLARLKHNLQRLNKYLLEIVIVYEINIILLKVLKILILSE